MKPVLHAGESTQRAPAPTDGGVTLAPTVYCPASRVETCLSEKRQADRVAGTSR